MSTERSSSAVRNLRSIFENNSSGQSPDTRGRSSSERRTDIENNRPSSRVHVSFVPVEPSAAMAAAEAAAAGADMPELQQVSSAGLRRGSFSEGEAGGELTDLKKTVSQEQERREKDSNVAESIPESAIESAQATPRTGANKHEEPLMEDTSLAQKEDQPTSSSDGLVAKMKEKIGQTKHVERTATTTDGEESSPVDNLAGDGSEPAHSTTAKVVSTASKTAKKVVSKITNGKPTSISTKPSSKAASTSIRSPTNPPKTPLASKASGPTAESPRPAPHAGLAKKASRSSLTAPTAASVARAASSDKSSSRTSTHPLPTKPIPRETTKPLDVSSRLTAPTAASKAKHEPIAQSTSTGFNGRASTSSRPAQPSSARPTPRSSLAPGERPASRTSQASARRTVGGDGSFVERMTRPTAASQNRVYEKAEAQSPPKGRKSAVVPKSKTNGSGKAPAGVQTVVAEPQDQRKIDQGHADPLIASAAAGTTDRSESVGNATPISHSNGQNGEALEATPAFGGEEAIR